MRFAWLTVFVSATAVAAPKLPTTTIVCFPDDGNVKQLYAIDDDPVICWDTTCARFARLDYKFTSVTKPADAPTWTGPKGVVRDDGGKLSACNDKKCKPLGKKLLAAIDAAKGNGDIHLAATADLKAVAFGGEAWSVDGDKPLKLKTPKEYRKDDGANLSTVEVAGDWLVATWYACAGPCANAQLVDSSGTNKGAMQPGGGAIVQFSDRLFAVISEYGSAAVYDVKTGALVDSIDAAGSEPEQSAAVRLGDGHLGILRGTSHAYVLDEVNAYDDNGKPHAVRSSESFVPKCPQ